MHALFFFFSLLHDPGPMDVDIPESVFVRRRKKDLQRARS